MNLKPNSTTLVEDRQVLKHVNAVALMPVKGGKRISMMGRRIYNVLLHRAQAVGEREEYEARLHEIIDDLGFASKNTALIRKVMLELMSTTVQWQSPSSGEVETWDACNLLSGAGTTKDKHSGGLTVRWRFDSMIRARLLSPDRFARLSLEAITQLTTHSAIALYEICARYVDNPGQKTSRQHWRWWKPVLTGVPVVDGDTKVEYRFFKRDTLAKAVAEINRLTNLEVRGPIEYKEKDNRTISDIQFEVRLKKDTFTAPGQPLKNIEPADLHIIGRGINAGVTQKVIEELLLKHGNAKLAFALNQLEHRLAMPLEKVGEVLKPGHLLKYFIEMNAKSHVADVTEARKEINKADIKKQYVAWTDEWLRRRKARILNGFKELGIEDKTMLLTSFREYLTIHSQPTILKRFDVVGWDHKVVRATFLKFYGPIVFNESWDTPTTDDIFEIAAELALQAK